MPLEIIKEDNLSSPQQHMKQLQISRAEDLRSARSSINLQGLIEQLKTPSILNFSKFLAHDNDFPAF